MSINKNLSSNSGKTMMIVAAAVVVVAVGGLLFMTMNKGNDGANITDVANAQPASGADDLTAPTTPEIVPGNPVVATVEDKEIMRTDVLGFINQLPEQTRQQPLPQLFAAAQEQLISARVIEAKTASVNLEADEEYQAQLTRAKEEITRNLFLGREVEKRVSEARMKEVYDSYISALPEVEERKARHILMDDEAKANEVLAKVKAGEDFAALAAEHSKDGTAQNGGELGYFAKTDVVPEFAEAVFSTAPGQTTANVVKSQFGFHIITVDDARTRPAPEFEALKPQIEVQVRREALDNLVEEWKTNLAVERFDINGNAIEPAAGE